MFTWNLCDFSYRDIAVQSCYFDVLVRMLNEHESTRLLLCAENELNLVSYPSDVLPYVTRFFAVIHRSIA